MRNHSDIKIYPLKDGKFMVAYFDQLLGRKIRKIFATLKKAEEFKSDLLYSRTHGGKSSMRERSVKELMSLFIEEEKNPRFNKSRRIFFEFLEMFGEFKAKDLTIESMEIFMDQLQRDYNYSKKTMGTNKSRVNQFVKFMLNKGAIEENLLKTRSYHVSFKDRFEKKLIISSEEVKRLLGEIKKCSPGYFYPIALFAWETGVKKQELVELKWNDLYLEDRLVNIAESEFLKARKLKLSDELIKVLKENPRRSKKYVFPDIEGKPFSKNKLMLNKRELDAKTDFDKRWTFPMLRNSYAYNFLKEGGDKKELVYRLGIHHIRTVRELMTRVVEDSQGSPY